MVASVSLEEGWCKYSFDLPVAASHWWNANITLYYCELTVSVATIMNIAAVAIVDTGSMATGGAGTVRWWRLDSNFG